MKAEIVIETEQGVDEYDDYQHEISNELANFFVEEKLLPLLDDFDFNNECQEYIPGIATFCLFAKLLIQMMNDGYSVDDLKDIVEEFSQYCVDDTVH